MKHALKMYVLYFLGNSVVYLFVDSFREFIAGTYTMTGKLHVSLILIAVLSIVSVAADKVWRVIPKTDEKTFQARLVAIATIIIALSAITDFCLTILASRFVGDLHMTQLDCILLAGLCQAPLIAVMADFPRKD